jgi:hypothetical protein
LLALPAANGGAHNGDGIREPDSSNAINQQSLFNRMEQLEADLIKVELSLLLAKLIEQWLH